MKTLTILDTVSAQPFFAGMRPAHLEFLSGCGSIARFRKGDRVLRQGEPANTFYIIGSGRVALDLHATNRLVTFQTLSDDEMLGWSWLVPPYQWHFDARAVTDVACIAFDAACVRRKCEADAAFGYEMYKRFTPVIVERLMATRVQALQMYQ